MLSDVVLWLDGDMDKLAANRTILCTRSVYLLENLADITIEEYNNIIIRSGSAGIIQDVECSVQKWYDDYFREEIRLPDTVSF